MRTKADIKHNAFTLAEMMVALLILTVALAALAPVMTTRVKKEKAQAASSVWHYASGNKEIYYGTEDKNVVMIGQASLIDSDPNKAPRLIINASTSRPNHILFKNGEDILARLTVDKKKNYVFTSTSTNDVINQNSFSSQNSIVIGDNANASGRYSIAIGSNAHANGYENNIAIGASALYSSKANRITSGLSENNIAIGTKALYSSISTKNNIAIGTLALNALTSGDNNIAIGTNAAKDANSINNTIAIGGSESSGYAKVEGNGAIAIGLNAEAIGDSELNTGIPIAVGYNVKAEDSSIAIGSENAYANSRSIALGSGASASNKELETALEDNSNNIAIGFNSKASQYYDIAIGEGAIAHSPQSVVIGYNAKANYGKDNVVIGSNAAVGSMGNSSIGTIVIGNNKIAGSDNIIIGTNFKHIGTDITTAENSVSICDYGKQTNRVKIGTNFYSPPGSCAYQDSNNFSIGVNKSIYGKIYIAGIPVDSSSIGNDISDRRLKNILSENSNGLDKIRQLKIYNYTFKKDKGKEPHVGVIAQDLLKVFPNSVKKDREGYFYIRRDEMFYALINAIKEIDIKISFIEKQLENFKNEIVNLRNETFLLKKEMKQIKAEHTKLNARTKRLEKLLN